MDTETAKLMLENENIDFGMLAEAFPGIADYFKGTRPGQINKYDVGVRSVKIEGQGKDIA